MSSGWCQPAKSFCQLICSSLLLLVNNFLVDMNKWYRKSYPVIYSIYSFICLFPAPPFATHFLILSGSWPAMQPLPLLMISYGCLLFFVHITWNTRCTFQRVPSSGKIFPSPLLYKKASTESIYHGNRHSLYWSDRFLILHRVYLLHLEQTLSYHEMATANYLLIFIEQKPMQGIPWWSSGWYAVFSPPQYQGPSSVPG